MKKLTVYRWLITSLSLMLMLTGAAAWYFNREPEDQHPFAEDQVIQLVPSPAPGVHTNMWWHGAWRTRDLDMIKTVNIRWVKQLFAWQDIEGAGKGAFNWDIPDLIVNDVEKRGVYLLARLSTAPVWSHPENYDIHSPPDDYQDFADFCAALAQRYKGRIHAYQVWNEPNLAREWGGHPPDPLGYTQLLAACYHAIKTVDPSAIVISAGMAPTGTEGAVAMPDETFIRTMYDAGAAQYFDMLGVNAPGYAAPPEMSPDEVASRPDLGGYRWESFRHVEDIRKIMIEYGDASKQIAILEFGWTIDRVNPHYSWFAVTPDQQAEYILNAFWWARTKWQPWIGIMIVIYLADPYWTPYDEQYWWALNRATDSPDFVPRPSWYALERLPAWDYDFYAEHGW